MQVALQKNKTSVNLPGAEVFRVAHIAFSPDGKWLACSGARNSHSIIAIVEAATNARVAILEDTGTWRVRFSRDGKTLASWGNDKVHFWDTNDWKQIKAFDVDPDLTPEPGAQLSPDNGTLAIPKQNGKVILWDIANNKEVFSYEGKHPLESGFRFLAFTHHGRFMAIAYRNSIRLLDLTEHKVVFEFQPQRDPTWDDPLSVLDLQFSSDDRLLAVAENHLISLWDIRDRIRKRTLEGHEENVIALAFSPDGKMLASGAGGTGQTGELKLWDLTNGKEVFSLKLQSPVRCVAFSPDGKKMAYGVAGRIGDMQIVSVEEIKKK
jgi:WD40 repeat protein